MEQQLINEGLADISAEKDATLKSMKLASLCSALWAERGVELVVVGGSAIEFLTAGAYASGDLDMCLATGATLPVRLRQEIMGRLGAKGAGEGGVIPVGGVIANALAAALGSLGVKPRELPLTPPRVWQWIRESGPT